MAGGPHFYRQQEWRVDPGPLRIPTGSAPGKAAHPTLQKEKSQAALALHDLRHGTQSLSAPQEAACRAAHRTRAKTPRPEHTAPPTHSPMLQAAHQALPSLGSSDEALQRLRNARLHPAPRVQAPEVGREGYDPTTPRALAYSTPQASSAPKDSAREAAHQAPPLGLLALVGHEARSVRTRGLLVELSFRGFAPLRLSQHSGERAARVCPGTGSTRVSGAEPRASTSLLKGVSSTRCATREHHMFRVVCHEKAFHASHIIVSTASYKAGHQKRGNYSGNQTMVTFSKRP